MGFWPFKKKAAEPPQPQFQDRALTELAVMSLRHPDDPTPGSDRLDAARFDYSIESLGVMDDHLEYMRTRSLSDKQWNSFILRAGAYVGEVIRRHTPPPRQWHWLDFKQAAKQDPRVASLEMSIGMAAVLWDGKDGMVFPLAKVAKFIWNGREDSVKFLAQIFIAGPPALPERR
jgi:hypothetical protein